MHKKIITKCNKIAKDNGLKLKNNYQRYSQKLLQKQHNRTHYKRRAQALLAAKELRRIAGVIMRNVERQLSSVQQKKYANKFSLFKKAQEQDTKGKIYSFHELEVHCISKGKIAKKYEFGSKFGILWSKASSIIVSGFDCGNQYAGHSLNGLVAVHHQINTTPFTDIYCDRGYRGTQLDGVISTHSQTPTKKRQ